VQQEVAVTLHARRGQGDAWRFELLPNRSSSWLQTKRFLAAVVLFNGVVAATFVSRGLWVVAPFSGLEVLALAVGLYCSARATYRREVILVTRERVVVLRGHHRVRSRDEWPRAWARLQWQPSPAGQRGRLFLGSRGRFFEVGAFLVDAERRQLASELGRLLGQPLSAQAFDVELDARLNREMGL
jgi:uncharacterized membrane protein